VSVQVQRWGAVAPEVATLAPSGELFELEERVRQVVTAFRERPALVAAEEARKY
jgi:hypothetical protein